VTSPRIEEHSTAIARRRDDDRMKKTNTCAATSIFEICCVPAGSVEKNVPLRCGEFEGRAAGDT
jgi:hypothetical protein